jgi:hypothetical protein
MNIINSKLEIKCNSCNISKYRIYDEKNISCICLPRYFDVQDQEQCNCKFKYLKFNLFFFKKKCKINKIF